jgi:hypothetical protein
LNGETALIMVPSARYASASAWKPAPPVKPRSTTTSGVVAATPNQSAGTSPTAWIHSVLHGSPHAAPTLIDVKFCRAASANGTGSPGTRQAVSASGALAW